MIYYLTIILTLMFIVLVVVAYYLRELIVLNETRISADYGKEVNKPRTKPSLKAVKQVVRGRRVVDSEELVDIADLPFEEAYRVIEDIGK